jgi:predicted DNA-binding protein YlxM (UPF0122 family)
MSSTENTEETIVTDYSPIEVAKAANVRPQMVYGYIKKGYIESIVVDGKIRIEATVADEWVAKYTTKKAERDERKAKELAAQLAGE